MAKKEETKTEAHLKKDEAKTETNPKKDEKKSKDKTAQTTGKEKSQTGKGNTPSVKGNAQAGKGDAKPKEEPQDEIKHIIRIADTDLVGNRSVLYALTGIKGVSRRIAKLISNNANVNPTEVIGYLDDANIEKLQTSIDNVMKIVPSWMMNKQNNILTGDDRHIIGADVMMGLMEDLNLMKKMRSYKGLRHERGLRVRGQRTRSTGRRGKTVGVTRASLAGGKK